MKHQVGAIRSYFPDGVFLHNAENKIIWEGNITPSPNSQTYRIKVDYSFKDGVKVYVVNPFSLALADGACGLPHIYSQEEQRICLYYPDGKEWNGSKYLVRTIFPWASEWLLHYELWLITGQWLGGGKHHEIEEKINTEQDETKE